MEDQVKEVSQMIHSWENIKEQIKELDNTS